ncbi:helix-turn-helix transcriptional regulator [Aeromicrobium panaciterrae]|uniref:helix-turn-helix transcriptional regulator n=1 Tax=Aeromicrobium panaciterrae TaxID=363861 RepID=UPI0031D7C14E
MDLEDVIDGTEAAKIAGVGLSTFVTYVKRGHAPKEVGRIGGRRVYSRTEIEAWAKNRPGRGRRMDLAAGRAKAKALNS